MQNVNQLIYNIAFDIKTSAINTRVLLDKYREWTRCGETLHRGDQLPFGTACLDSSGNVRLVVQYSALVATDTAAKRLRSLGQRCRQEIFCVKITHAPGFHFQSN